MARDDGRIEVRSYRVCFDLERRIHKLDRWRIPLPYGLPLRGVAYFVAALAGLLVLGKLPGIGMLVGALHPALRLLVVPAGAAALLMRWTVDGRSPHAALLALLRLHTEPRRVAAFRPVPAAGPVRLGPVTVAGDERGARWRAGVVEGPASVVVRYPARLRARGRALHVTPQDGPPLWRGKQIRLQRGQRLVVG